MITPLDLRLEIKRISDDNEWIYNIYLSNLVIYTSDIYRANSYWIAVDKANSKIRNKLENIFKD